MTRFADRICGRMADKVPFGLSYGNDVSIWFDYSLDSGSWKVMLHTRHARVSHESEHLYTDCKVRMICADGINADLEGATIKGFWEGDTEIEKAEARTGGSVDGDDEQEAEE